jgi:hypothetical protein
VLLGGAGDFAPAVAFGLAVRALTAPVALVGFLVVDDDFAVVPGIGPAGRRACPTSSSETTKVT